MRTDEIIGPNRCSTCGGEYGEHESYCKQGKLIGQELSPQEANEVRKKLGMSNDTTEQQSNRKRPCDWQGYGFGASYEDAGCCGGEIGDLDDDQGTDADGNPLIGLRDETCPQCGGTGEIDDNTPILGPMALIRQRTREGLNEWIDAIADADAKEEIAKAFDAAHKLINKLEQPKEPDPRIAALEQQLAEQASDHTTDRAGWREEWERAQMRIADLTRENAAVMADLRSVREAAERFEEGAKVREETLTRERDEARKSATSEYLRGQEEGYHACKMGGGSGMSHKPGPKPKNELPIRIESVIVRLSNGTTLEGDDFGILIMERGFPAKRCSYEQFIDGMKAIEKQREQNDKTTLIEEQSNG